MANVAGIPIPDDVFSPDFPEKAKNFIERVNDWIVRKQGITFLVVGVRATGKTTFLRVLRGLPPYLLEEATQNPIGIEEFKVFLDDDNNRPLNIHDMQDLPGQDEAVLLETWETAFQQFQPSGVIYIIDDFVEEQRVEQHQIGLERLINILTSSEHSVEQLMVLFNRSNIESDKRKPFLGEPSREGLYELCEYYNSQLRQLEDIMLNIEMDVEIFGRSGIKILGRRLLDFGTIKGWFYIEEADIFDQEQLAGIMAHYFDLLITPSRRPNN